ncbi:MAG: hypothetical protein ACQEW9_11740 [Bacteroidota bacterium]
MKKTHQVLQIILLAYFGLFLIFFIAFDTLGGLFGMQEVSSDDMVKIILLGFILFLISWLIGRTVRASLEKKIKNMETEMNGLKAKIYDMEHPKSAEKAKTKPSPSEETESSNLPPRQNFTEK